MDLFAVAELVQPGLDGRQGLSWVLVDYQAARNAGPSVATSSTAAPAAAAAVAKTLAGGARALRIDLALLTFIDSSGLQLLLSTRDLCRERGVELRLQRGGPALQRIRQMTRLETQPPFHA